MKKKVLIVDDSASVRSQVKLALSDAGFEVLEAYDGQDGLAQIEKHDDLALVICDVNMPRVNGLEMLTELKANIRHAALPVVMLTTEGKPEMIQRAKEQGAKGWIIKPFKPHLLAATAHKLAG